MPDIGAAPPTVGGYAHGRVPRGVREGQLLALAETLLIAHGYGGFSIEDLCRAAGVSRPVVYDHFGSRDGVYLRVLRRIRDELDEVVVEAARTAATATEAVERGVRAFFSTIDRDPRRWSLVYGSSTVLVGPLAVELYELRARTIARLAVITERFAPEADPLDHLAFAQYISGAGEQLGRWWIHEAGEVPIARVVDAHVRFTVAALETLTTSRAVPGHVPPTP